MVHIADAWLTIIGMDPEPEDPEDGEPMAGGSMMGEPERRRGRRRRRGRGLGEGKPSDGEGFGKAIKGKVRIAESKVDKEHVEAAGDESAERRRQEREADADAQARGRGRARGVRQRTAGHPMGSRTTSAQRPPTDDERRAAKSLARALEQIDYRDRAVTKVTSMVPPGRLRGRAAVQAEAYAETGRDTEVEVWSGKRRTQGRQHAADDRAHGATCPASMNAAMEPLASAQWVIVHGWRARRRQVASVHFGDNVEASPRLGSARRASGMFYPGGGSEAFRSGALAIDKELNAAGRPRGSHPVRRQRRALRERTDMAYAKTFNRLAARKGVAVIYLNFLGAMGGGVPGRGAGDRLPGQESGRGRDALRQGSNRGTASGWTTRSSRPQTGCPVPVGFVPQRSRRVVSPFVPSRPGTRTTKLDNDTTTGARP